MNRRSQFDESVMISVMISVCQRKNECHKVKITVPKVILVCQSEFQCAFVKDCEIDASM